MNKTQELLQQFKVWLINDLQEVDTEVYFDAGDGDVWKQTTREAIMERESFQELYSFMVENGFDISLIAEWLDSQIED